MRDTIKCKGLFLILPFDNVVAQFIGQLCLMNQATTKSIFLPFVFCFAGMSNPPYGGVEPPFLKGDLAGFLDEVMRDTIKCKGFFLILPFDNVVAQFIGQLCLMNQATTKSIFLPFVFCFAGMSNPPYGGVDPPFLKGDLKTM